MAFLARNTQQSLNLALQPPGHIIVRTGFDLAIDDRALLQTSVDELSGQKARLNFEVSPALICGIELSASGQKVAWSIAEYLSSLQAELTALLPRAAAVMPALRPAVPARGGPATTPALSAP